ncbi:alpha/beta hydrolase fold family protein [Microthyrium microscopicum]|uniref:Alpha/beta hydrolase fold family protein n=1 Tax=Microthyrium microscopicum TaxID=703497 RepID=A0A6A6UFX5_9PEZI|nr:alpha/beta hydrolase fold family protein [Microthyrium microscopicum]
MKIPTTLTRSLSSSPPRFIHTSKPNLENQTLTLPDGRTLGFAEYGSPTGYPLLFFHGFPSSRLEAGSITKLAHRRNIRLFALDRPGFGLSTFQPNRKILDWPADVFEFAHHVNIERFAVLGGSGGGPYALACARVLPHEMMSAVGLFASAGPWRAGTAGVPRLGHMTAMAVRSWPAGFTMVADAMVNFLKRTAQTDVVTRYLDGLLKDEKKESQLRRGEPEIGDKTVSAEESVAERRELIFRIIFEAFAQGARGTTQEAELLSDLDWGFDFEDVDYDKVQIWHGTQDKNAPVQQIRYLNERLPHSILTEYDGSHFDLAKSKLEEVLAQLVPEAGSVENGPKT